MLAELVQATPQWREHPDELLQQLLDAVEELADGALVDDVAMLLIGNRAGAAGGHPMSGHM